MSIVIAEATTVVATTSSSRAHHHMQQQYPVVVDYEGRLMNSNNGTCQISPSSSHLIPWVTNKPKQRDSDTPKVLLHQELKDFIEWISPTEEEKKMRNDVVNRISKTVLQLWPQARVEIIGSFKTELCLPMSDIDLVIFGAPKDVLETGPLYQLSSLLEENRVTWPNAAKVITTAKVPIIKIQEMKSLCFIDISFDVNTGLENTKIIQNFVTQYPVLRDMTLVIKYYLKQNYLNDTWTGGIGSYTLVILIISYLQQEIKRNGKEKIEDMTEKNLAELLIGFFELYGIKFNYNDTVISVKDNCYYDKKTRKWLNEQFPDSLSVEDPYNPDIDVGSACFQIARVKKVFEEAFLKLTSSLQQSCISYLAHSDVINPNFITKYRYHIKLLYGKNKDSSSDNSRKRNLLRHTDQSTSSSYKPTSKPTISFIQIHYKNSKKSGNSHHSNESSLSWDKGNNNNHNHNHNHNYTNHKSGNQAFAKPLANGKIKMDDFPELIPIIGNHTKPQSSTSNIIGNGSKIDQQPNSNNIISLGNGSKMDQMKKKMKKLSGMSANHN